VFGFVEGCGWFLVVKDFVVVVAFFCDFYLPHISSWFNLFCAIHMYLSCLPVTLVIVLILGISYLYCDRFDQRIAGQRRGECHLV
jgi:hypothetical protein